MEEKRRNIHMDILRLLAAFLVIYNHTAGYLYYRNHTNEMYKVTASILLSAFTKVNVPVFFMLSGALLLGKEESYRSLLNKRVGRFFLLLLCASVCAYCCLYREILSLEHFLYTFFSCEIVNPYWFLYAYLAFLLALPLLRKMARALSGPDIAFLLILRCIASTGVQAGQYFAEYYQWNILYVCESFALPFATTDILFYPLLGYYLEHHVSVEKFDKRKTGALLAILAASLGVTTAITVHQGVYSGVFTEEYMPLTAYITASCLYLLVKAACVKVSAQWRSRKLEKVLGNLAGLTLGIYLMDPILMTVFGIDFVALAGDSLYLIPLSLVYCCISMVLCGSITWILKKIPGIRKLL